MTFQACGSTYQTICEFSVWILVGARLVKLDIYFVGGILAKCYVWSRKTFILYSLKILMPITVVKILG